MRLKRLQRKLSSLNKKRGDEDILGGEKAGYGKSKKRKWARKQDTFHKASNLKKTEETEREDRAHHVGTKGQR